MPGARVQRHQVAPVLGPAARPPPAARARPSAAGPRRPRRRCRRAARSARRPRRGGTAGCSRPAPRSSTASTIAAPGCSMTRRRNVSSGWPGRCTRVLAQGHHPRRHGAGRGSPRRARTAAGRRSPSGRTRLGLGVGDARPSAARVLGVTAAQRALLDRDLQLALAVDRRADQARRTAGAAGSGASAAPGGPGWRRSRGARRPAARRTRPGCCPGRCRRTPGRPPRAGRGRSC